MAAETEIERLIVRLVGDASSYQKMMRDAEVQAKKSAAIIEARLKKLGGAISRVGRQVSFRLTLPLLALGAAAIKVGADFDSGFAGVRKTVDATETELGQLREGFKGLIAEIPVASDELLAIGEIAGQLGIETDQILSFTKTIAQLGVATNLTTEEAATSLARFANVTGLSQDKVSNLGSAIVALGNSLATSEREIVSMATRLAGAGSTIGLTEDQILAFAGALSSVGLEAEAGGTAFSKLFLTISQEVATAGDDLETFAAISGKTVEEFSKLFREDAAGALQEFLQGLNQLNAEGKVLALKELGIESVRMTDSLLRASNAVELLGRALQTSEQAFFENTALAKEAAERFKTFWSQVQKLKNQIGLLLGDAFEIMKPTLTSLIEGVKTIVRWFRELEPSIKKTVVVVLAVVAAIGPLLILVGGLVALAGLAIAGFSAMAAVFASVASAIGTFLISPLGITVGLLTAATVAVLRFTNLGTNALAFFQRQWIELTKFMEPAIRGMGDALKSGDLRLAMQIAMAQVELAFFTGIKPLLQTWAAFTFQMKSLFFTAVDAIATAVKSVLIPTKDLILDAAEKLGVLSGQEARLLKAVSTIVIDTASLKLDQTLDEAKAEALGGVIGDLVGIESRIKEIEEKRDALVNRAREQLEETIGGKKGEPIKVPKIEVPGISFPKIDTPAKISFQRVTAAEFGSAEAQSRLEEFRALAGPAPEEDKNTEKIVAAIDRNTDAVLETALPNITAGALEAAGATV